MTCGDAPVFLHVGVERRCQKVSCLLLVFFFSLFYRVVCLILTPERSRGWESSKIVHSAAPALTSGEAIGVMNERKKECGRGI